ncbi:hypothetical protein [Rhizobium sp. 18055]|jgi:hypothetical protein|nr:hypothetical protein [Rhizobium sp. 18055]
MTMAQFAAYMIMPVGALLIGFFMLYITRKDRIGKDEKTSSR